MYYAPYTYPYSNYVNRPTPQWYPTGYGAVPNEFGYGTYQPSYGDDRNVLKDYGANPFVININEAAKQNNNYRTALWTGKHLQLTVMSINVGDDIGLEVHPNVDQFIRIEQGQGIAQMGKSKDNLDIQYNVFNDSAIFVPAGIWHNVTNTGNVPMKLYSIYAPPNHPFGTVQPTKANVRPVKS